MPQVSLDALIAGAASGCLVSFPTDTVPALAVQPEQAAKIFVAKRRQQDKPLILMGATPEDLWPFVTGDANERQLWQQVAASYWPGALTLVLPAAACVPRAMNPTNPTTIGLRVPKSAIALRILAQTGPLATTSANLSGQSPLMTMAEIASQFPDVLILLPTELESDQFSGVPSTVAKWTGRGWQILRQGAVILGEAAHTEF